MNNVKILRFIIALFLILAGIGCNNELKKSNDNDNIERPTKYEWELVSEVGAKDITNTKFIYIDPTALADENFLKDVIKYISINNDYIYLLFFDDKQLTPLSLPMTDEQMLHFRARYAFNPSSNFEEFAYYEVTNKASSPPTLRKILKKL